MSEQTRQLAERIARDLFTGYHVNGWTEAGLMIRIEKHLRHAAGASVPQEAAPPPEAIQIAMEQAQCSPCRSKRGAVVFYNGEHLSIRGRGHNRKPDGFDCDGTAQCKATCRDDAIHAEQKALLAGLSSVGCDLLHVKSVDGRLVASGGPSCVQCSKLALAAGIAGVWLYHGSGWLRYPTREFHALSLAARLTGEASSAPQGTAIVQPPATVTRLEVIDHRIPDGMLGVDTGRVYSAHNCAVELSYQDDGRTLKVFIDGTRA